VFSRYRVELPPPAADPSAPSFEAAVEEYVRRVRGVYEIRATENRRNYRLSGIAVIVAGASLPLLTTLNYSHKELVISLVGIFVSAVTALRAFYRWDHTWALLRVTEFSVSKAYWKWRFTVGAYPADGGDAKEQATRREAAKELMHEVSAIRDSEALSFFKDLPFPEVKK
jgi:hypothetical protein